MPHLNRIVRMPYSWRSMIFSAGHAAPQDSAVTQPPATCWPGFGLQMLNTPAFGLQHVTSVQGQWGSREDPMFTADFRPGAVPSRASPPRLYQPGSCGNGATYGHLQRHVTG